MSNRAQHNRKVVITGVGAVTNIGRSATDIWNAMCAGKNGISLIEAPFMDDFEGWTARIAGQVKDFDPCPPLDPREARRLDRSTQLGMFAAEEAVLQSGLDFSAGAFERRGVVVGSGVGGIITIEEGFITLNSKGPRRLSPFTVPRLMVNATSGNLSIRHNLQGPASAHATACASSGHAMLDAANYIRRGRADVMLAGGTEAAVSSLCIGAFMTMKALSTRNDAPEHASRPFDRDRDGFVLAEGAGMVVLESEEHAKARGATILCEFVGGANSSDASHITAPNAEGRGAARSMEWALEDTCLNIEDIDYINAHGTSTPLGDSAEITAVLRIFGEHARASAGGTLMMSSTKSMHGHCLGASGAVESVACIGAIRNAITPPTVNLQNPDDGFDIDLVPNTARERPIKYAMNNTFGFGGHNVTMIFGKYDS